MQQLNHVQNTQLDHEKAIIDGLCDAIRSGYSVPDFISLLKRLYQDELKHIHSEAHNKMAESLTVTKTD